MARWPRVTVLGMGMVLAGAVPAFGIPPWSRQSARSIDEVLGGSVKRQEPFPDNSYGREIRPGMTYEQVAEKLGGGTSYRFGRECWVLFDGWGGIGLRFVRRHGRDVLTSDWTNEGTHWDGLHAWPAIEDARLMEEAAFRWCGPDRQGLGEQDFLPRLPDCGQPADRSLKKLTIRFRSGAIGYLPLDVDFAAILGGYWSPSRRRLILQNGMCGTCCLPTWSWHVPDSRGRLMTVRGEL